ncbi:MAG: hypothetical protein ABIO45_06630 [Burkholderiaceae bacterium]
MDFESGLEPAADKFCDLVMKGGITSGVVYPAAIEKLSHHYRFKSIGGTSAGAIAAALTAAAEYNRRTNGSRAGFDILKGLSAELGQEVAPDRRRLVTLFQPDPGLGRLFAVLEKSLNRARTSTRIMGILWGFVAGYWLASLAAAGLAMGAYFIGGWLAFVLALVVAPLVLIGSFVYFDVTHNMVANGFGLCTGMTAPGSKLPALVPWLHDRIQRAAGLDPTATPLTFGMLWDAPGMPEQWKQADPGIRSIDLRMFSTNLSQGRPYIFPLAEKSTDGGSLRVDERLFFKVAEIGRYLPEAVTQWMVTKGTRYVADPNDKGRDPPATDSNAAEMVELPQPRDFPVILAARMSLSFPVLFAGVPLWAIHYDAPRGKRTFRRCWFSDGGLCSNFPMHLFDGLVPSWPTFGIDLEPRIPERKDDWVYLPRHYGEGYGERWNRFDDKADSSSRCGGFFIAMIKSMQNWNDNALSRMPGVRDRIARVRLTDEEGGMNLNMEASTIEKVTQRGVAAIDRLIGAFDTPARGHAQARGWDEQRWIRLAVLLKAIQEKSIGIAFSLSNDLPHATPYAELLARAGIEVMPGYDEVLSAEEQQAIRAMLDALDRLARTRRPPLTFQSVPKPDLRVRPPM